MTINLPKESFCDLTLEKESGTLCGIEEDKNATASLLPLIELHKMPCTLRERDLLSYGVTIRKR